MQALKVMWQVLWSVPMAVLWVGMYFVLWLGWGLKSVDLFIKHWNNFIDEDSERRDAGSESTGN